MKLRTTLRIAWRELRASRARFLFVILAVAAGVGALTGVRGFSNSFRGMLLRQARTLMAADLTVRIFALPAPAQETVLRDLETRGVRRTWITETVTMASSRSAPDPLLVSVKAVDPRVYPFYGTVRLAPPRRLSEVLDASSTVVSDDLLIRLKARVGDSLRIGGQEFRIAGSLVSEPDRMTGTLNVGPRVLVSREGMDRTGLIGVGSRASERYLFRLRPEGPGAGEVRAILKDAFPEATIADYTQTHPIITRGLNRATTFLSLIGLIALVIGAIGVASAMHGHLQQKMDSIAVMKCIGALSGQVIRIYVVQTLMLGLAGGVLGAAVGVAVASAFPRFLAQYFSLEPGWVWNPWAGVQGVAVACLVTLLFTVPRLTAIRDVKPALVLRRHVESGRGRGRRTVGLAYVLILLGVGGVAATLTEGSLRDSVRTGVVFTLGLAVGVGLLAASAWVLLRAVKRLRLRGNLRQGIANLHRPGNQSQAAVVALGVGVMFTSTVFLVQGAVVNQIRGSAPPGMPNVFLLDIPGPEQKALAGLIAAQPGVTEAPEVASAVSARLIAVNGVAIESMPDYTRRFRRARSVTELAVKPPETAMLQGAWWRPDDPEPQVCAEEETASILGLRVGSVIDWNIWQHPLRTRVACIQRTESIRLTARFEFLFSPGHLANYPAVHYGTARVRPANVAALQRVVYERFPTVTVVNMADVMQIVEEVVGRMAMVIRFISAFTILAGAVMVASSVAGTRFRRMREVVILKTLGATRGRIAWIFSVEFLALGIVAGVMGSVLASGFAALVLTRLLEVTYVPDPRAGAITVVLAALVAAGAGWAASVRILNRRPLEILREE